MKTSMLVGVVTLAGTAVAGSAWVGYENRRYQPYAEVISAKLVTTPVAAPHERCHDETVTRALQQASNDENAASAFIGAVVDRALGRGAVSTTRISKRTATRSGSTAAYQPQNVATYTTTQQHCETVYDAEQEPAGYDVRYHYSGRSGVVHMDHDPGKRIPVEHGELVLNDDGSDGDSFASNS